jgi:Ran GTPase-activating protein (RanGAP) involved in mRNA processing and transport
VAVFEAYMLEMDRSTTILKMAIVGLSCQQLQSQDAPGSAGLAEIVPALYRNTSIQRFDISDNGLDDLAAATALRQLLRRNRTITTLNIHSNIFGRNVTAVSCIAHGFSDNTTLQELDLSSCELDDQGLSILAESLGQHKRSLVNLNLSANLITCSGLRALVNNATAALSTVTNLDLSLNPVLDEGAIFLAETSRLQTLPSPTHLSLVKCRISDDGIVVLMSALEENQTLEYLDFENNALEYVLVTKIHSHTILLLVKSKLCAPLILNSTMGNTLE